MALEMLRQGHVGIHKHIRALSNLRRDIPICLIGPIVGCRNLVLKVSRLPVERCVVLRQPVKTEAFQPHAFFALLRGFSGQSAV